MLDVIHIVFQIPPLSGLKRHAPFPEAPVFTKIERGIQLVPGTTRRIKGFGILTIDNLPLVTIVDEIARMQIFEKHWL